MTAKAVPWPASLSSLSLEKGLELLLRAFRYAETAESDPWFFAVEVADLERAGLSLSDLRWLIASGHALHADEQTHPADTKRRFGPTGLANITDRSCFVLTAQGARTIEGTLAHSKRAPQEPVGGPSHLQGGTRVTKPLPDRTPKATKPSWDSERRELTLGQTVIKRFRVPAANQELLLSAFHEQDWPTGIDDPLVPTRDQDPKERLKAAIRCLNRNQLAKLIRFRGNGNGMRIYWEHIARFSLILYTHLLLS